MKILLTVHQFLPDYAAGTEILTLETARELRRRGHDVSVFTGYPECRAITESERFDSYSHEGIPVERFRHAFVPLGEQANTTEAEYSNHFFAAFFEKFLARLRPDVVHFFHLSRLSASAVDVCRKLAVPMVLTPTDFWFICPTCQLRLPDNTMCEGPDRSSVNCVRHIVKLNQPAETQARLARIPDWLLATAIWAIARGAMRGKWYAPPVRALHARAGFLRQRMNWMDRVLVPTRLMERLLARNGLEPHRITYLPYGINLDHIQPQPKQAGLGRLRLGYIGTLYEHKGVHILVQAVRSLPQDVGLELKIYGREDEFPEYVSELKARAAGDPRIRFCGTFPNREIGSIFASLDALVVPSLWYENTPLVIYSAQAARCPVIASNLGGMAEAVQHGENGLLFPAGDAGALTAVLLDVARTPQSLQRLGEKASRPPSIGDYVSELLEVYQRLIEERRSAAAALAE